MVVMSGGVAVWYDYLGWMVVRFYSVAVGCTVGGIWSVLWMDGGYVWWFGCRIFLVCVDGCMSGVLTVTGW